MAPEPLTASLLTLFLKGPDKIPGLYFLYATPRGAILSLRPLAFATKTLPAFHP